MTLGFETSCLIGCSGLLGNNLKKHYYFEYMVNSSNLCSIQNKNIDLIICAAPSATKWQINIDGAPDLININNILRTLSTVNFKKLILCSTIDVYGDDISFKKNELDTPISSRCMNYSKNRIYFECELKKIYREKVSIIRFPGLFGDFLKKNIIFDIKSNNKDMLLKINHKSEFQWYNLKNLNNDILNSLDKDILNISCEPIKNIELLNFINIELPDNYNIPVTLYDVRSIHSKSDYFYYKDDILKDIKDYLAI